MHRAFWMEPIKGKRKMPLRVLAKRLLKLLFPYKWVIVGLSVVTILSSLVSLAQPYLMKLAVDEGIGSHNMNVLLWASVFYLACVAAFWLFDYIRSFYFQWMGSKFVYELREKLFNHIVSLPHSFFTGVRVGDLIARVMSDCERVQDVFVSGLVAVAGDIVILAGSFIIMFSLNAELALVTLLVIPAMVFATYLFTTRFRRVFMKVRQKTSELTTKVQESVSGVREIQAFAKEDRSLREFKKVSAEALEARVEATKTFSVYIPLMDIILAAGSALVIWYGGIMVVGGRTTIGVLLAFLAYTSRFFRPIFTLVSMYNLVQEALVALERIFEVLDVKPETEDTAETIELEEVKGHIVFEDVWFSYDKTTPVLRGVSFEVKPGEKLAIVGPTGAGKTTLVYLICKFYNPDKGRILVDGIDLRRVVRKSLRRFIGYVPQDTILFPGTVKDNIRIGKPDATDEKVVEVCKKLRIHHIIESLPQGYDTDIGEFGKRLSAGQRQLISIARALLKNPPILILDEAMSNVDPATEATVKRALEVLMEGRTTIIIAHRLTLARDADQILVLEDGQVVERGSHEELMAKKGIYYKLYTTQMGLESK